MPKPQSVYECQQCGYQSPKWLGKCTDCGAWNSLVEERAAAKAASSSGELFYTLQSKLTPLDEIGIQNVPRVFTQLGELDRLLGGGMVPGSVILLGGDPGI
ncbi:MAG TPA: DNA repair protein RadA, partial [Deltaproteobacteria bacterium]|nr:DNA repair protein RadA [Deltaproteobacteria bacterium]